jgi:hypothetical protein
MTPARVLKGQRLLRRKNAGSSMEKKGGPKSPSFGRRKSAYLPILPMFAEKKNRDAPWNGCR